MIILMAFVLIFAGCSIIWTIFHFRPERVGFVSNVYRCKYCGNVLPGAHPIIGMPQLIACPHCGGGTEL